MFHSYTVPQVIEINACVDALFFMHQDMKDCTCSQVLREMDVRKGHAVAAEIVRKLPDLMRRGLMSFMAMNDDDAIAARTIQVCVHVASLVFRK